MTKKNLNTTKISNRQIIKTTKHNKFFDKNFIINAKLRSNLEIFLTPEKTIKNIESISIKLYSHNEIIQDSCGEITSTETLHFRTFRPISGGLYCEKIFGSVDSYTCSCGKFVGFMYNGIT